MARAIIYLRVSTDDQSTGLEVQEKACRAYAARQGLPVAACYVDEGLSGSLGPAEREGLTGALAALEDGDVLVVHKRDRLARSVLAAAIATGIARKSGATIASTDGVGVGDDPESDLLATIVDAFAQYERAQIAARTRRALAQRKARGLSFSGKPPYGWTHAHAYRDGVRVKLQVPDEAEQAVRAQILELHRDGGTYTGIARTLNEEGVPGRTGLWYPAAVRRVVRYAPPEAAKQAATGSRA